MKDSLIDEGLDTESSLKVIEQLKQQAKNLKRKKQTKIWRTEHFGALEALFILL